MSSQAHCLNLKSMQTRTLKPMLNKRMGSGVASINGIVYVAGGSFNSIVSSLAERYITDEIFGFHLAKTLFKLRHFNSLDTIQ